MGEWKGGKKMGQAVDRARECAFHFEKARPPTLMPQSPFVFTLSLKAAAGQAKGAGPQREGKWGRQARAQRLWNARHPGHPRLQDYWLQRGAKNSLARALWGAETPPGSLHPYSASSQKLACETSFLRQSRPQKLALSYRTPPFCLLPATVPL